MKLVELNIGQAAYASGVSAHIIANAVDAGQLPAVVREDGGYYIARADLEPFLALHGASIDESKFNAAEIFPIRTSPANSKFWSTKTADEHGLITLAKQQAVAAGEPLVEMKGTSLAAHVRHRVATEVLRRSKS